METLSDAIREVMRDDGTRFKYPEGMTAVDVLDEIRLKFGPDVFPLCTWLDVHDDITAMYGPGRPG